MARLLIASLLLAAGAASSAIWAPRAETALLATADGASAHADLTDSIVVTRDSLKLPSGCSPREVGVLISRFTDALNAGDQAALARLFVTDDPPGKASEPAGKAFRWYSVTEARSGAVQPWRHRVLYDRADLFAYFGERHQQHERIVLIEVIVSVSQLPEAVGLTFRVRREADDLPAWLSPVAGGKAGIECTEHAIYLWSMGQTDRDQLGQICPHPPGWKPGVPVVSCSSGPNAIAVGPEFRVTHARVDLPNQCKPAAVRRFLTLALSGFDIGHGNTFAKRFAARGQFHPYTGTITRPGFVGRRAIARYVGARYRAGDGWTATRLLTPQGSVGLPKTAAYRLAIRLSYQGVTVTERTSAKVVIDCRSGLIETWLGPARKAPPAT